MVTCNEISNMNAATTNITKATVNLENNNRLQHLQLPLHTIINSNPKISNLMLYTGKLLNENSDNSYLSNNDQGRILKSQSLLQNTEDISSTPKSSTTFKCLNSNGELSCIGKSIFYGYHYVRTDTNETCSKGLLNQHHQHSEDCDDEQKNTVEDSTNGNNDANSLNIKEKNDFNNLTKNYSKTEEGK